MSIQDANGLRICFVVLQAYSLLNTATSYRFGGVEVRSFLLGQGLSQLPDYDVSFVVYDNGQPSVEKHGNICVYAHSGYQSGARTSYVDRVYHSLAGKVRRKKRFPFITFQEFNIPTLLRVAIFCLSKFFQAMRRLFAIRAIRIEGYAIERKFYRIYEAVGADVYCVFGVHHLAAEVAAYCEAAGKQCLLFAAADGNFSNQYRPRSRELDAHRQMSFMCYFAITHASRIITQSQTQSHLLKLRFGRDSTVIRNPMNLNSYVESIRSYEERDCALWVGRSDFSKRPEVLVRLAAMFTDIHFEMVIIPGDPVMHRNVLTQVSPNVTVHEYIPFDEIEKLYSRAFVCINTSPQEGFPNAFLQAGKYGVPVLSLDVDPDDFIKTYQCGIVADGDFDRLVEGLCLLQNKAMFEQCSANIREYVRIHHDLETKVQELDQIVQLMATDKRTQELS